jgi:hypothetical protein
VGWYFEMRADAVKLQVRPTHYQSPLNGAVAHSKNSVVRTKRTLVNQVDVVAALSIWKKILDTEPMPCPSDKSIFDNEKEDAMYKVTRSVFENPFVISECNAFGLSGAPIATNIYETYGQCNEDLIIEALLRANLHRAGRAMDTIRYIEIGANHPFQTSSTYLLNKLHGGSGVLVEAIPGLADTLRKARPRDTIVNCAITDLHQETIELHVHEKNELSSISREHISNFRSHGGSEKITGTIVCQNIHINDFMQKYYGPYCDYLSVDVEGVDAALLSAMDHVFQPTIVQCEHNSKVDDFLKILQPRGYSFIAQTDVNAIFMKTAII